MEKKEQSRGSLKEEMTELEEVRRGKSPIQHKLLVREMRKRLGIAEWWIKTRQER